MMNEKFMELADQLKWESDVSYGELMRFAELIVRECILICGAVQGAGKSRNMNDFAEGAAKCKEIIKRDFELD